jgi:hypothetical protein
MGIEMRCSGKEGFEKFDTNAMQASGEVSFCRIEFR